MVEVGQITGGLDKIASEFCSNFLTCHFFEKKGGGENK